MKVRIYSTRWCADCWRAKWFLKSKNVPYEEINIDENREAATLVMMHNGGSRRVPTFEVDGSFYGNPPLSKLAELLDVS